MSRADRRRQSKTGTQASPAPPPVEHDPARPLLMSQVAAFYERGCITCAPSPGKQGGVYVVHHPPTDKKPQHTTDLAVCGCAKRQFSKAHSGHVTQVGEQLFWRKDYQASGSPELAPKPNAEPHQDPLAGLKAVHDRLVEADAKRRAELNLEQPAKDA
jgi:hypothetical protein